MDKFSVGEIALIIRADYRPEVIGLEAEIIQGKGTYRGYNQRTGERGLLLHDAYRITIQGEAVVSLSPESHLKKLDPPNDPASWEDTVWKPETETIEA